MNDQIKVHVVAYKNRPNLVMRYVDPLTGKQVAKSAKTSKRRDAERKAAKWEAELREGRYQKPSRVTWEEFRDRYDHERLSTLSERTMEAATTAFNHLERVLAPKLLAAITSDVMSRFQASLIDEGMKPTTLASHLRSIVAGFSWAVRKGIMVKAPDVDMPKSANGLDRSMRGRPITGEELDRMLAKVGDVRKLDPEKWKRLLNGLWLSGLRLGEALALSWDQDAAISVHLAGKYPKLRIWAEAEKAKRDRLLLIAPEFSEFLMATPEADRVGLVFGIEGPSPGKPLSTKRASRYISAIGAAAKVIVAQDGGRAKIDKETGKVTTVPKFAGAHDLRRAFGTRWSKRVMPAVLKQLMRHRSIETTMSFYVEHNADDVSADLLPWASIVSGSVAAETQSAAMSATENTDRKSLAGNGRQSGGHGTRTHNRLPGT
jgi:integrase